MNTKRHLSLVLLGMIIVLPLLTTSCFKKGEEDPFFSIYTRKARVIAEWDVTEMNSDIKRTYADDVQTQTTTTVNGETWNSVIKIVGTDSIREIEGFVLPDRHKITFEKDGRFREVYEYEYSEDSLVNEGETVITTITRKKEETSGTWNFLYNIDDYKNKERLAIVIEERKITTIILKLTVSEEDETIPTPTISGTFTEADKYANGEMSTIWTLIMLKNKQIKMEQNINYFHLESIDGNGDSYQELGFRNMSLTRE